MRSVARYRGVVWLGAALVLAACMGPPRAGPGGEAEQLGGTAWRLAELNGEPPVVGTGDALPTLMFAGDEPRVSGNGGCNQFNGPYTQNGALLSFGPLASTAPRVRGRGRQPPGDRVPARAGVHHALRGVR